MSEYLPPSDEVKVQFANDRLVTEYHWIWSTVDNQGALCLVVGTRNAGAFSLFFKADMMADMMAELERWRTSDMEFPGPEEL